MSCSKPLLTLSEVRRSKGLTLAAVAQSMRSTAPAVSDFESGKADVTEEWIRRYSHAVGQPASRITIMYLLAVEARSVARLEWVQRLIRRRYRKRPLRSLR